MASPMARPCLDPGETVTVNGTEITCPEGGEACVLTVSTDVVTGAKSATSTGGEVEVTTEASRMAAERERIRKEHEGHRETLRLAEEELERVQELYDAGDATANELKAAQEAVAEAKKLAGNIPPTPPDPVPEVASGMITHDGLQAAFEDILDEPGDSDTFEIPAGGKATRGGLEFTCDSAYPCTVTISQQRGDHRSLMGKQATSRGCGRLHDGERHRAGAARARPIRSQS